MANQTTAGAMHWERTRRLTFITLGVWFFFSFFIHWFGSELNNLSFLGYPLGFYMGAQGSPLAFVLILYFSTRAQERIDDECGVAED